jgi:hypothetical protein
MKKHYLILTACLLSITLLAQEETSSTFTNKKGIPMYPQPGDWAVGINATPFFLYVGNFFSGYNANKPEFGFTANAPGSIYAKYVKSSKTRYRGVLHIGITTQTDKITNPTDDNNPHRLTESAISFGLTAALEKTRSISGRFTGIYGAQIGFLLTPYEDVSGYSGRVSYKDANNSDQDYVEKGGRTHSLGAGGFVGVEFFIAPKVSLSGEFGLNLVGSITGKRVYEPGVGDQTVIDPGAASVSFSPEASGDLVLIFYL